MVDFKEDYKLLAKLVNPPIKAFEARQSVKLLLNLGLIKKTGSRYEQTNRIITTGEYVRKFATDNFHLQNLELAAKTIEVSIVSSII